jgi:hypothetical protein
MTFFPFLGEKFFQPLYFLFHNDQIFYTYCNKTKLFRSAMAIKAQHREIQQV